MKEYQPNSFKVNKVTTKQGYTTYHINGKSFIRHFNLSIPTKFLTVIKEEDFIVADLA